MTARDVTGFYAIFSARKSGKFLHFGAISWNIMQERRERITHKIFSRHQFQNNQVRTLRVKRPFTEQLSVCGAFSEQLLGLHLTRDLSHAKPIRGAFLGATPGNGGKPHKPISFQPSSWGGNGVVLARQTCLKLSVYMGSLGCFLPPGVPQGHRTDFWFQF